MKNSSHEFTIRVRKRLKVVGWTERHLPFILEVIKNEICRYQRSND